MSNTENRSFDAVRPTVYREKGRECRVCSDTKDLNIHHLDMNRTNNSLDNLIPLCETCHHKVHHKVVDHPQIQKLQKELPEDKQPTESRTTTLCKTKVDDELNDRIEQIQDDYGHNKPDTLAQLLWLGVKRYEQQHEETQ